ncbi:hypothetical protein [Aeromonas sp. BIGb0445]|jgi:hypothetical protein|uniref:hypothetical protein n=1 Tax=Aeromonas sp. BIGb0445 TaxID=2940593 RepID=UPI00216764B9|nr:hypothetical protein [Aeromonas sp. BIGb0445]MCS3460561.1 hypothetical protein [Aeromonas sp. BIGb0445]
MTRIEEHARQLDREYQALNQLFNQFCQLAGALAEQYHFFSWPDYEETPPLCRAFTLLGEPRELRLRCQPTKHPALDGLLQILDETGTVHASLSFRADGQLQLESGHLLDDPPKLFLKLLLGAVWQHSAGEEHHPHP